MFFECIQWILGADVVSFLKIQTLLERKFYNEEAHEKTDFSGYCVGRIELYNKIL